MASRARDRGIVSVLAILLLCMLCALAVACTSTSSNSVAISSNHAHVETARLQAESGLSFLLQTLYSVRPSPQAVAQGVLAAGADALMIIDRSDSPEQPPGFVFPSSLEPGPDSYREVTTPGQ